MKIDLNKNYTWEKLGVIFDLPQKRGGLYKSHTSNPTSLFISDNIIRIFFSSRDAKNRSSIFSIDFDLDKKLEIKNSFKFQFKFNENSKFYSEGVTCASIYSINKKNYLTFMGWVNKPDTHWYGTIGRLLLDDSFNIRKKSVRILLEKNKTDKVSVSYPYIYNDQKKFIMIYGSTISWESKYNEMIHLLNYAVSKNGTYFYSNKNLIKGIPGKAQAFSRPTIFFDDLKNGHMWFSYRGGNGDKYKIGYALKTKGSEEWKMNLQKNILTTSENFYETEMVEYPYVFEHKNNLFMLYNGNAYGKTGILLAKLKN